MRGYETVEFPASIRAPLIALAAAQQRSLDRFGEALRRWGEPIAEAFRELTQAVAGIRPPTEAEVLALRCYSAALDLGATDKRARPWLHLGGLMPWQLAADFLPHLPDPTGRSRGHPKGPGPVVAARLKELVERVALTGEDPTVAAKVVVERHGVAGDPKGPADHLVRLYNKRES